MKWLASRTFWGVLLIIGGIIFLLDNLGIFTIGETFWGVILGIGAIGFLSVYLSNRENWWALIPGMILLSVSALIIINAIFPGDTGALGGVIVLGGIGLAFLLIYLTNRENWWAIIPAGVMLTLSVVVLLGEAFSGIEVGGIFFLGLGLTFGLVAIIPTPHGQMKWAFIPAGIMIVMGLLITAALSPLINYIWPSALILAGLLLVFRAYIWRR
jgi:hypothetical protein